jgi:multidrug efflux pump subunit AcrA (membrane-fusion protein)
VNIRLPWHVLGLMAVLAAAVVAAVLELGPPTRSTRTSTEVVTAGKGVVQSTVTGTGNVEPGTDVEANFQTSGTLQKLYVKDGDHVVKGQLLATLDPTAAQLTVEQAKSSLTSAQDNLTNAENQTATSGSSTSTSLEDAAQQSTEFVTFHPAVTRTTQTTTTATTPTTTSTAPSTTTTQTATTPTRSTPSRTTPASTRSGSGSSGSGSSGSGSSGSGSSGSGSSGGGGSGSGGSGGSGQTSTTSAETIAANIASAQAAVDGAQATLRNAENALDETRLYAPATGTVVNVASVSPGDAISGGSGSGSGSNASSSSGSTAGSGSSSGSTAGSLGGSDGSSSSSSSSSSSGLVEIVNTGAMTMTVAFSESDISKIKVGEPANVTLEALSGVELAAHVSSISTLGTSSSGVVSYDATLMLDQHDSRVKPGMSASAAVITGQASGVNLPNSAVTTTGSVGRVDLLQNGKVVPTSVVVGLVGDSRTQIVSGLRAGAQVQVTTTLPALGSGSSALSSGSSGTLGGAGGLGGGAARFLGGGGAFPAGGAGLRSGGGAGFRGGG